MERERGNGGREKEGGWKKKQERKERGDKGREGGTEGKRSDSLKFILYPR